MGNEKPDFIIHKSFASDEEVGAYRDIVEHLKACPIPEGEILANIGLFLNRSSMSRIFFTYEMYQHILQTHGVIMEFGVRWGHNLAVLTTFRNMYEPYNYNRKIIGFDTFEGFPNVSLKDGGSTSAVAGGLSVTEGYENYLSSLLSAQERLAPRSHIMKHEIVKGDVLKTLPKYLEDHPETIIALAYFDLDLYEPTKKCLELIQPHLLKNSIIGFDELNFEGYPGETVALKEYRLLSDCRIHRNPLSINQSFLTFE